MPLDVEKSSELITEKGLHSSQGPVPSLLKWTGSKRSQATRIAAFAPDYERYFEPFLGGGAMLFLLGCPKSVGGDIYSPLVEFWKIVRDEPKYLISNYRSQWEALQRNLPDYYYFVRERFNDTQRPEDLNFLMRTCVNGIVRFSRKGDFNNSFHLSRRGMKPERFATIVYEWSQKIQGIEFRQGDYAEIVADAGAGDFIYFDPPYAGSTNRYINDLDIERFYNNLESLNQKCVKWALSFDGQRGETSYEYALPKEIYKRKETLSSGYSAVSRVLNGPVEMVHESLYMNY